MSAHGIELLRPARDSAPHAHPVRVHGAPGLEADVSARGELRIGEDGVAVPDLRALPDARILHDGAGSLLVLGDPTTAYGHGVLGDRVEGGSAVLVDVPSRAARARIRPPPGWVIEGIAPIWADLDADGTREIVLTESSARNGARLAAYDAHGAPVAASAPIGLGYRWRHQLAVASTTADGVPELIAVRTPHIGGTAEFLRLRGDRLVVVAGHDGVSSHAIGSRNLDLAAAIDWDGDGDAELLVPSIRHDALVVVERTAAGTRELARLAAGGRVVTNLAGAAPAGRAVQIGVGTDDGRLRIWVEPHAIEE